MRPLRKTIIQNQEERKLRSLGRIVLTLFAAVFIVVGVTACSETEHVSKQKKTTGQVANERETFPESYVPHNHVEFNNFNEAQKIYDTPSTIQWCTTAWANPSAPLVTVPVAGKLTSSSVSYLPQDHIVESDNGGITAVESFSNDGMYHGHPPAYRYGFTPGHQYVDFFGMEVFCTTAMTEFQRKQTKIALTINPAAEEATKQAEAALKAGTNSEGKISSSASAKAQSILEGANLSG
jgi:hypothetical protein